MGDNMTLDEFIEELKMIAAKGNGQATVSMRDGSHPALQREWALVGDDFNSERTLRRVVIL